MSHDPEAHLPPHHAPLPELDEADGGRRIATPQEFAQVQASGEFAQLRGKFRAFAFPMTLAFLLWYFLYVLLSTYAEDAMSIPVVGHLNVGLLFGLAQFASTFLITWLYVRHANRALDPIAARLRTELEGDA
jgi:uncharacterized membrane protein (DUF485 family)